MRAASFGLRIREANVLTAFKGLQGFGGGAPQGIYFFGNPVTTMNFANRFNSIYFKGNVVSLHGIPKGLVPLAGVWGQRPQGFGDIIMRPWNQSFQAYKFCQSFQQYIL